MQAAEWAFSTTTSLCDRSHVVPYPCPLRDCSMARASRSRNQRPIECPSASLNVLADSASQAEPFVRLLYGNVTSWLIPPSAHLTWRCRVASVLIITSCTTWAFDRPTGAFGCYRTQRTAQLWTSQEDHPNTSLEDFPTMSSTDSWDQAPGALEVEHRQDYKSRLTRRQLTVLTTSAELTP